MESQTCDMREVPVHLKLLRLIEMVESLKDFNLQFLPQNIQLSVMY